MDLITVVIIGVIVAATGVINPKPKSPDEVAKAPANTSYNASCGG